MTLMIDPYHTWNALKRPAQCAEQQESPSNIIKYYCGCHEFQSSRFEQEIRDSLLQWTLRPAASESLPVPSGRGILFGKIQLLRSGYLPPTLPNIAPATKKDADDWSSSQLKRPECAEHQSSAVRGSLLLVSTLLFSTLLFSSLLYSSLLFSLFSTLLFSTVLFSNSSLLLSSPLYYSLFSTILYSSLLYSTLLYYSLSCLKLHNSEVCHPNFLWLQLSLRSPQKTSFTIPTPYKHFEKKKKKQLLSFMKFLCQLPNSCSSKPFSSIHQISLMTPRLTADPGSWSRNRLSTSCNASNQEDGVGTSVLKHPVRPTAWGKTQPPNCQKSKHEFLLLNPSQITCRKYFFPWLLIKGCISNTLFWGERRW